jgi:MFS family permease
MYPCFERQKWDNSVALLVSFAIFCDMLVYGIDIPVLPTIAAEKGIQPEMLGLYLSSYSLGMVVSPLIATLSDRYSNRKIPMISGSLMLGLASYLFAVGSSGQEFLAGRIFQGIAGCVTWMIGFSMLAETFPHNLGAVMGSVMTANTIGNLLGAPLGGAIYDLFGKYSPLHLSIAVCMVDTVIRCAIIPPFFSIKYANSTKNDVDYNISDEASALLNENFKAKGIFQLLMNYEFVITLISITLAEAVLTGIEPTLPLYLADKFEFSNMQIGMIWTAISVPKMISCTVAGYISDIYGRKPTTMAGLIIFAISCGFLAFTENIYLFIANLAVFGVGAGVSLTPCVPELADIARTKGGASFGKVYSLHNIASSSGMLIGPIIASWTYTNYGFAQQFLVFGMVLIIAFILIIINEIRN